MIDTKELRKHIEQLQEYSAKHSDVLHSLRSDCEDVNQHTQEILGNTPYGNGLMEILYKNEVGFLLTKMEGADRTFSYFKKSINRLHDDLDKLESQFQTKEKAKVKVKSLQKSFKTFFIGFIGSASLVGIIPSLFMFAKAMSNSEMRTGAVWFLITTFCLAVLLSIWNESDS